MGDEGTREDHELDVIFGEFKDRDAVSQFVQGLRSAEFTGTLYIGYPVLSIDDEKIEYDAVFVSRDRGVLIFDLFSYDAEIEAQNVSGQYDSQRLEKLYAALYNRLNSFSELRSRRSLAITISTVIIHPIANTFESQGDDIIVGLDELQQIPFLPEDQQPDYSRVQHLNAAIQRISNLKPRKKRDGVKNPRSKGAIIKEIEKKIANLDLWQKRGSIEYVNGPQRIRGLAGSGKTVVLALKAAYLHVKRPDWQIVITFNTRSLYQQFETLITRFVYAQINDDPDWSCLRIMHAWGGSDRTGVYREYVAATGQNYRDFSTAARLFGYGTAFTGACDEAYGATGDMSLDRYDMILVDEAQDLPASFFSIVYNLVKEPKRIVWAYDSLQNLSNVQLPSARELFGTFPDGRPRVELTNEPDQPQQDIVLPRCYRNPPWTLLSAHGLGFGVNRAPMVQMFTDPQIWERLGYQSTSGPIDFCSDVRIERKPESVPDFFYELLRPEDSLCWKQFETVSEQYEWVAREIRRLLDEEELEHTDILLILPDVLRSKSEGAKLLRALASVKLQGHIPGQTSSRDTLFRDGSIAITHIFRAKGNEAPVVFCLNSDFCENASAIKVKRNIIFTSITRSRAWTIITGVGNLMEKIGRELSIIAEAGYALKFTYPDRKHAMQLAVSTDNLKVTDASDEFEDLRAALKRVRHFSELPTDLQKELADLSGGQ